MSTFSPYAYFQASIFLSMHSFHADYFGFAIVICIGIMLMLIPLSTWIEDFGGLMLVAVGTAIVCLCVFSLRDFARKQKEKA